jgi:hypothetical protein
MRLDSRVPEIEVKVANLQVATAKLDGEAIANLIDDDSSKQSIMQIDING